MELPNLTIRLIQWVVLGIFGRIFEKVFTRTTVSGLENVPRDGGTYIFAGNHASTYEPMMWLLHIPLPVRPVGPGDFPLLFPGNIVVEKFGIIRIKRSKTDRDSLKKMMDVLKSGQNISIFPEGGTWEKRLDDVKPGVAYLSLMTGAQIIPVSVGGTYQVWRRIFRLQRPRIHFHFSPPMPPVTVEDRKQRQKILRQVSLDMMAQIYESLPAAEQERYDLHERQRFSGSLEIVPNILDMGFYEPNDYTVLAELISKPNLFSPLVNNFKLPLTPFTDERRFFAASEFKTACQAMVDIFQGDLEGYLDYRLGERKSKRFFEEMEQLLAIAEAADEQDLVMRFRPQIQVEAEPLPPND